MEDIAAKVNRLDKEMATHREQIKTLFKQQECLTELTRTVATLAERVQNVVDGQTKIEKGLEELKAAPARKWDLVIAAAISAIVGGVIGRFLF